LDTKSKLYECNDLLLQAQNAVFTKIANHAPLKEVFETMISSIEEILDGAHVVFHLVDESNIILKNGVTAVLPQTIVEAMNGSIINKCDQLVVLNLQCNSSYERFQEIAKIMGYKTCWSKHIISKSFTLGSWSLFFDQEKSPTTYEIQLIHNFTQIACIAIERKQMIKNKEIYHLVENNISDLITVIDSTGCILYASPSHMPVLGMQPSDIVGKMALNFIQSANEEDIERYIKEVIDSKSTIITENKLKKADGSLLIVEARGTHISEEDSKNTQKIVVVSRDITSRKSAEETIRYMAYHDPLTGLPNRRKLREKMERLLDITKKGHTSFCILFVDLDNFKMVNDLYGHEIGDSVLVRIAERLKVCLADDYFIARWGGDEFAVVSPLSVEEDEVRVMASKLLEEINKPFEQDCCHVAITPSIGISVYPRDGQDLKTLFDKADQAMYRAKDIGKNNIYTYHI
jgi:diguanylate cyclase (GGDEF)-like protein/PAS domain S-box-containing protein